MFHLLHIPISGSDSEEIWEELSDNPETFVHEDPPPALPQDTALCHHVNPLYPGWLGFFYYYKPDITYLMLV